MIRIVRGPRGQLSIGSHAVAIEVDRDFPVPWAGARALVAALRARHGDEIVTRALAPARAELSLVLRGLDSMLDEHERSRRAAAAARPLGFMSHNAMTSSGLRNAWTRALRPLCAGLEIVVPEVATVDADSIALLRHLLVPRDGFAIPSLVLAFDPEMRRTDPLWQRDLDIVAAQIVNIELLRDTTVEPARGAAGEPGPVLLDTLDDQLELAAARSQDPETIIRAMRAAFACFGYSAVLRLGLDLIARAPALSPPERAELHTLIALAAYNRQVETGDNEQLAELLEHHFSAAFEHEREPARRSHLLYRLCINRGRRKGALDEAHALATQSIDVAREVADPVLAAYLEAWARNGRAYVHARQRRLADAMADCERAHELLCGATITDDVPENELAPSRIVILDNLARLAEMGRDLAKAADWQRELERAERTMPDKLVLSPHRWASLLRAQGDLVAAIAEAERGLADARENMHPIAEDRFAADLGDLYYRIGDARRAFEHFDAVLAIRRRARGDRSDAARLKAELSGAVAAARAGLYSEADAALAAAFGDPQCAAITARAELTAARGLVAARRGDGDRADAWINDAIDLAVEAGAGDTLLRVARTAGDACRLLGRTDEARDAFERALDIAGPEMERAGERRAGPDIAAPALAAELFAVYLGLAETTAESERWHRAALGVAAAALADPDAWWDLARLLDGIVPLARHRALAPDELAAARDLASTAAQRADCADAVRDLRAL